MGKRKSVQRGKVESPSRLFPASRANPDPPPPRIAPLRPTPVYDTYWRFAAERQEIFFRRAEQQPPPWTNDTILGSYKFTNAYRASDRTSQYLIQHVIYRDDLPDDPAEVFFRIVLFKLFNRIDTWELDPSRGRTGGLQRAFVQALR